MREIVIMCPHCHGLVSLRLTAEAVPLGQGERACAYCGRTLLSMRSNRLYCGINCQVNAYQRRRRARMQNDYTGHHVTTSPMPVATPRPAPGGTRLGETEETAHE